MFDKFKQLNELRKLQKQLKEQKIESEKNGVKVVVNGGMEVEQISMNPELDQAGNAQAIKEAVNDAMKQMQKKMAEMMRGTDLSGLGL